MFLVYRHDISSMKKIARLIVTFSQLCVMTLLKLQQPIANYWCWLRHEISKGVLTLETSVPCFHLLDKYFWLCVKPWIEVNLDAQEISHLTAERQKGEIKKNPFKAFTKQDCRILSQASKNSFGLLFELCSRVVVSWDFGLQESQD